MKTKYKNKLKKLLLIDLLFVMILVSSLNSSVKMVKADSNYSNYLTSETISVKNDRALILLESSGSSNNYRNYYETGFLFPSKLRNEMYSIDLTVNPSKYYIEQVYLSDLNNEYAFSGVENLGQYETNTHIESYDNITENNGYYNNTYTPISNIYSIDPNQDSTPNDWHSTTTPHFAGINDWILQTHYIYVLNDDDYEHERFGFENISIGNDVKVNNIRVKIYGSTAITRNDASLFISLNESDIRTYEMIDTTTYNIYVDFEVDTTIEAINNLEVEFIAPSIALGYGYSISSLQVDITIDNSSIPLEYTDNNYYNYISTGVNGTTGLFPSEYTFTDDIGNPAGFTVFEPSNTQVDVIDTLDGHDKIVEIMDNTASDNAYILNSGFSESSGNIEFWISFSHNNKQFNVELQDGSGSNCLEIVFDNDGNVKYDDGSLHIINSYSVDIWYHYRIEYDISDNWHLWINKISQDSGIGYSFKGSPILMDKLIYISGVAESGTFYSYIDAIDLSWSPNYFINRNYYDSENYLNISGNLGINRLGNSFDNLEYLNFEYTFKSNNSCNLDLYLLNINSNDYELVDTNLLTTNFQEFSYTFDLNYTYYSHLGIVNFMFYISTSYNLTTSIDKFNLNSIFSNFSLNDKGFHNINLEFNRKTSGSVNRGNISFNLELSKTNFTYDYIENNVIENDYSKLNQFIDFSNDVSEIQEIEIQGHIRYGLNTLDIDIVNVYYLVIINYNYTYELFEQLRYGNNDGNYFRSFFSYDSMNFNRMNNTGIFGNYSMNCLSGLRVLRGGTDINYNRYFLIPYFDEKITLSYVPAGSSGVGSGSEPKAPSGTYWKYETYRLSDYGIDIITVENWSVDFNRVYAEKYEAKYYYQSRTISRSDLGSWRFKITDDWRIDFNFIRNALCDIINLILLFFQYIFFLVVASFSYILMYLGINIIVLLWNVMVFYVFIALIWILWYFYSAIYWLMINLWSLLLYIYEVILIPLYIWLSETAIPWIVEFLIIPAIAFTLALLIWIITLGRLDFWELYEVIKEQLFILSDFFNVITLELIEHIVEVVLFIALYLLLIGMCFLKQIVVKVRGYVNRSEALQSSLDAYLYPIIIFYKICLAIKQLIANWF